MPDGEENLNANAAEVIEDTNVSNDSVVAESNVSANNNENSVNETAKDDKEENSLANSTEQEELYNIQYLIDNCKALGYKREVVAGALLNCEKTQMSKTEFKETVDNFLGKKVK